MNHRSLAFRLAVWYALLLSATFTLVGAGMLLGLQHYLRAGVADSLHRRSAQIEQILSDPSASGSDAGIADAISIRVAPEFNNRFVRVTRAPESLIYRSRAPADRSFEPAAEPEVTLGRPFFRDELAITRVCVIGDQPRSVGVGAGDQQGRDTHDIGGQTRGN